MANVVMLKHRDSGVLKKGFYGFSWTTFFFGPIPALFRCDFLTFLGAVAITVVLGLMTFGIGGWIAMIVWAFLYNKYYTRKLLTQGYVFDDNERVVAAAKYELAVATPSGN